MTEMSELAIAGLGCVVAGIALIIWAADWTEKRAEARWQNSPEKQFEREFKARMKAARERSEKGE